MDILDDVFDLCLSKTQGVAPEYLAVVESIDDQFKVCLELTISYPQNNKEYQKLELLEKIECYRNLFNNFKRVCGATAGTYEIEYHKNGNPHMHGFVECYIPINIIHYPIQEVLRMFAKNIFLMLPKATYKQFANAEINPYFKRFKSPAVCINLKENILQHGWKNYMEKTH